jgi:hypothetical protein
LEKGASQKGTRTTVKLESCVEKSGVVQKGMRCVGLELGTMAFGNGHPLV